MNTRTKEILIYGGMIVVAGVIGGTIGTVANKLVRNLEDTSVGTLEVVEVISDTIKKDV